MTQHKSGLMVVIGAEVKGLINGLKKTQRHTSQFGKQMNNLKYQIIGALSVGALISFGKNVVKVTSEVEEMQSKFRAVFKENSDSAMSWTETTSKAVKRSKYDLQSYMATLQDTFVPMGYARDEAMRLSQALTRLTIDVASFNNVQEKDVLRDFQSAIVGNHETVRKYGIIITQARLSQELMTMGIKGGATAATEAQKVMARYNIIMAGTADAHGDAERTADSFANVMKEFEGIMAEFKVSLGQEVLPMLAELMKSLNTKIQQGGLLALLLPGYVDTAIKKNTADIREFGKVFIKVSDEVAKGAEELGMSIDEYITANLENGLDPVMRTLGAYDKVVEALKQIQKGLKEREQASADTSEEEKKQVPILQSINEEIKELKEQIDQAPDFTTLKQLTKRLYAAEGKAKDLKRAIDDALRAERGGGVTSMKSKGAGPIAVNPSHGVVTPESTAEHFGAGFVDYDAVMDKNMQLIESMEKVKETAVDMSQVVAETIQNVAVEMGKAVGNMITATDQSDGMLKNIIAVIANFMAALGESMIALGLSKMALDKLMAAGGGMVAFIAGLALVAASQAIKNKMAQGTSFAEGGIVTGPTMAMVGDNRSGTEAIIPLEKMGQVFGNMGTQHIQVEVTGKIGHDAIYLSNERATAKRSRYR